MDHTVVAISHEVGTDFASLRDFCTSYPHGVGLYCDTDGIKVQRQPESLISRVYDSSHDFCLDHCHCRNIAPELPSQEAERPIRQDPESTSECANSDDEMGEDISTRTTSSTTCSHSEPTETPIANEYECDEYWYGRPSSQDCQQAMTRLPDYGLMDSRRRQFVSIGVEPSEDRHLWPAVRTPLILTHGE